MAFVADDLGAWLTAVLGEAVRRRLAMLVLGTPEHRALAAAASDAVQRTAADLSDRSTISAEHLTMVINEVFRVPVPVALWDSEETVLQALATGIAAQFAALDDPAMTGQGVSWAELVGVTGGRVAQVLFGHLMTEIRRSAASGGPLGPLASRLDHDVTHLHLQEADRTGRRVEEKIEVVREMLALVVRSVSIDDGHTGPEPEYAATGKEGAVGWPLIELDDAFAVEALEVKRAIQFKGAPIGLPMLPLYVPREHDAVLAEVVKEAMAGRSALAVLVGGSSTGKTRACWQAIAPLRHSARWRLWHPISPSRPKAFLSALARIGPRTVVWLNEAQEYLGPAAGDQAEQVASGLRELLRDSRRKPVLVLATLWPLHWDNLIRRTDPDVHAQARELLTGRNIHVPDAFTGSALGAVSGAARQDPRLSLASKNARDGQITQYLAGVPDRWTAIR